MSAAIIETEERRYAEAALAEGLARELRLWCADNGEEAAPELIEALAIRAAPGLLEMLGRRGFDLRRRARWPGAA